MSRYKKILLRCNRCGTVFPVKDARGHPKYCSECKIIVAREYKNYRNYIERLNYASKKIEKIKAL